MKQIVFCTSIALTFLLFASAGQDGQAQTAIDGVHNEHVVRATLSEEDPVSPGNEFEGSVKWRADKADLESADPYQLRADIMFPKRRLATSLTIRLNLDQAFPASHIAEIAFDHPHDQVSTVLGILVKRIWNIRGTAVPGIAIKSRPNVFTIAYPEDQVEETTALLYGRRWLEIAMVFANRRRPLLAIDKDVPGGAAFKQVFASWGQINPRIAQAVARVDTNWRPEVDPQLDSWKPVGPQFKNWRP